MKAIIVATAAAVFMSGAALAQTTTIQAAPPAVDTGSQGYQSQGGYNPGSAPTATHHSKKHTTKHKKHTKKHHTPS